MSPTVGEIVAGNGGDKTLAQAAVVAAAHDASKRMKLVYAKKSKMAPGETFPRSPDNTVHDLPDGDQFDLLPGYVVKTWSKDEATASQIALRKDGKDPSNPGRWILIYKDATVVIMCSYLPTADKSDKAEKPRRDPKPEKPAAEEALPTNVEKHSVEEPCGAPKRSGDPCGAPKRLCKIAAHLAWHEKHNKNAGNAGGEGTTMVEPAKPAKTGGKKTKKVKKEDKPSGQKMVSVMEALAQAINSGFDKVLEALGGLAKTVEAEGNRTVKAVTDSRTQAEQDQQVLLAAVRNLGSTPPPAAMPMPSRHGWPAWLKALFGILGFALGMAALFGILNEIEGDDDPTIEEVVDEAIEPIEDELGRLADNYVSLMDSYGEIVDDIDAMEEDLIEVINLLTEQGVTLEEIEAWMEAEEAFKNTGDCNVFIGVNVDGEILMKNVTNEAPWGFVQCTFAGGDNNAGNEETTIVTAAPPTGCGGCGGPGTTTVVTTTTVPGSTTTTTEGQVTYAPTAVARATNADGTGNVPISESTGKATICVSGSESHDNDEGGNSISSYSWTSNQGLGGRTGVSACWDASVADAYYTFTLTVTDDDGEIDMASVTVHVPGPTGA